MCCRCLYQLFFKNFAATTPGKTMRDGMPNPGSTYQLDDVSLLNSAAPAKTAKSDSLKDPTDPSAIKTVTSRVD